MLNQKINQIEKSLLDSIKLKETIVKNKLFTSIARMGELAEESIINDGKIMLCGNDCGCEAIEYFDDFFLVPSNEKSRIQEAHITARHALMEYIEYKLAASKHVTFQNDS